jgi:hypothetical protein
MLPCSCACLLGLPAAAAVQTVHLRGLLLSLHAYLRQTVPVPTNTSLILDCSAAAAAAAAACNNH